MAYDHVAVERSAAENAALQAKLAIEEAKNRQLATLLERDGKGKALASSQWPNV